MADETIQTQYIREAPEIEAYKVGLIDQARQLYNQGLTLPAYEAAGLSETQRQAIDLAKQTTGVYQPYLEAGSAGVTRGGQLVESGAQGIAGLDIGGAFQPGKATTASAISQMPAYMQANLQRSLGTLGAAEQAAMGAAAPGQAAVQQGLTALGGAAQAYDPTQVTQFMDPYQQQVIDAAMQQIERQGDVARQRAAAQAVGAGAFGSTREGVQRAELERGLAEQKGQAIAGLLSQGYQQAQAAAQQAFEQQQARQMQQAGQYGALGTQATGLGLQQAQALQGIGGLYGQQALQQAQLGQSGVSTLGQLGSQQAQQAASEMGLGMQKGTSLASMGAQQAQIGAQQAQLGSMAQAMGQADVSMLSQAGAIEAQNRQAQLDAARQTALQQTMAPYQQLAFVSDIYKGAPSSQMALTQTSAPSVSPAQQALGTIAGVGTGIAAAGKIF